MFCLSRVVNASYMRRLPWQRLYFGFVTKIFSFGYTYTHVSDTTASTTLAGFLLHVQMQEKFLCFDFHLGETNVVCMHRSVVNRDRERESQSCIHVTSNTETPPTTQKSVFLFIILFVLFLFFLTRCIAANVDTLKVAIISIKLI